MQIVPKIENAQSLLKFDTFDISNTLILNLPIFQMTNFLMSKMIFMKFLPAVRPN